MRYKPAYRCTKDDDNRHVHETMTEEEVAEAILAGRVPEFDTGIGFGNKRVNGWFFK
jgi:hypothetical protein